MSKVTLTPWTDAVFDAREAEFAVLVEHGVGKMADTVLAALRKQEIITAAAEPSGTPPPAIPPAVQTAALASWGVWVETELLPGVTDVFNEGAELVVDALLDVYGQGARELIPPVGNEYADEYLQHANNRMIGVGENVWKGIKRELEAGLAAGEGIPQLAERLQNYAQMSEGRARTVARTEVISSANAGSYLQMVEAGIEGTSKEWLATPDEPHRTRLSHQHADDQAVPLTDEFQVEVYQGETLLGSEPMEFPGDPIATPGNVINCRCSLSFAFDDENGPQGTDGGILTAAGKFVEKEHPRDSKGKFMNKLEIQLLNAPDKKAAYDKLTKEQQAKIGKATKDKAGVSKNTPQKADAGSGPPLGGLDKKTGKKAPAGKPVFLRVKALFETDYEDDAVVAVRPESNERVVWDAGSKRMLLQKDGKTTDTLTRGALMKLRKDEEGWFTPGGDTTPALDLLPGQKPVKLRTQVVYSRQYADGELVAVHPEDDLEVRWDATAKRMLVQRDGEAQESLTRGALMAKYKDADGWFSPGTGSPAPEPDDEPDSDGPASEIIPVIDVPALVPEPPAKPAKKKVRKLYVEYNGVVHTRTTSNDYKFASVVNFPWMGDDHNVVYSWHKTEALAAKSTLTDTQKQNGAKVIAVLDVSDQPITPSVVPAANVPDSPQESAPTPADIPTVTADNSIPSAGSLTSTGKVVGTHGATIYRDNSTGKEWLFKPVPAGMGTFMADVDVATARLRELVGLPTPTTGTITIDGRFGSIQQMFEGATDPFGYNFKPVDLTPEDKLAIQKEQIFDWLISNHDGHSRNYVRLPDGSLVGVDKGQAFKFFGSDDLDPSFSPNPTMPAANLLMQAYANGEGGGSLIFGVNHPEIKKLLKKIDDIGFSDYEKILLPYANNAAKYQSLAKGGPKYLGLTDPAFPANDVDAFMEFAWDRKETLKEDFSILYADLSKQRKAKMAALSAPPLDAPPVQSATADGIPVKLNAAKLNPALYSHGQIVAVNHKFKERLVWDANTKKFTLQSSNSAGTAWLDAEYFSKTAAVKNFASSGGWTEPADGTTHADLPVPLPKIAGAPKKKAVPNTPVGPAPPFTVSSLLSQDSDYSNLPVMMRTGLFQGFLHGGSVPMDINATGAEMFYRLLQLRQELRTTHELDVSINALVTFMDDKEQQNRVDLGGSTYRTDRIRNRLNAYLSSLEGAQEAGDLVRTFESGSTPRLPDVGSAAEFLSIPVSKPPKKKLPPADFTELTTEEADGFFDEVRPEMSLTDIGAVKNYTSDGYQAINPVLRGMARGTEKPQDYARAGRIQRAMRPLKKSVRLHRGVGQEVFGFDLSNPITLAKVEAMVGQTFQEDGFLSTSITKDQSFSYRKVQLVILAAKGTPALYADPVSSNLGEHEMILAAGTKLQLVSVTKSPITGIDDLEVVVRVVP